MNNRLLYIDLIKAFSMFAVVFIHAASPLLYQFGKIDPSYWMTNNIYNSMMRMAVPLFFMASGALLLSKKDEPLTIFLKKRVVKVIVPFIIWTVIYIFFKIYILHANTTFIDQIVSAISKPVYAHLWFLYDIIGLYLFIPILRIFIHHSKVSLQLYFLILWFITVAMLPLINRYTILNITNHLPMMSGYIGYLVIGYLLKNLVLTKKYSIFQL